MKKLIVFSIATTLIFFISLFHPSTLIADVCESVWRSDACYACCYPAYDHFACTGCSCACVGCDVTCYGCDVSSCSSCSESACGCFTGETEISLWQEGERAGEQEGETKQIKDLKPGDVVESFNPETGEVVEGTVEDVTKTTREGYYILETEGGYKVKVTGEHPFLAIKSEKNQESINQVSNFKNQLKEIFSNTLTYRLITSLQTKMGEVLK